MFPGALKWMKAGVAGMALCMAVPTTVTAETLGQTLVSAYEHSGLLEQNRALLRAADEDVAQIVAGLRPIINWTADITRTFGRTSSASFRNTTAQNELNAGLTLDLLLFDFGETQFRREAAKETVLATRQTLRSVEQQVLLRAVTAFLDVQRNQQFVSLRQNNLRLLQQELRAVTARSA